MPMAAWQTAGVGLLMAVWWVTEALPIPATSLLPLAVFPLLDVVSFEAAARPYAHPLIFLFMGGFLLAVAMGRWGLPRRISLRIVGAMGTRPRRLVAGFMVSTALFSMWVSNTATALMMLPIGLSLVGLVQEEGETSGEFAVPLMLGIAYGASIGGVGTLIGTPPNAFLAAFMAESYGVEIGFARWMLLGIPLVALALPLAYWLLTRVLHPVRAGRIPGGRELVRRELEAMGPPGPAERRVAAVFGLTAGLWIFRPLLDDAVPGLTDAGVAMLSGLLLFLIPGINLAAPFLWLAFGAWMLALEYADCPLGNHGVTFRESRGLIAQRRGVALGFGTVIMGLTAVPGLNLIAMPVAVCGATAMYVGELSALVPPGQTSATPKDGRGTSG
jgi:sodium-dependent dicarboxylate transporter 2/3/5